MGLMKIFFNLWKHIQFYKKIQVCLLMPLMILVSVTEVLSISAVIPFMTVLIDPNKVFNLEIVKPLLNILEIKKASELIFPITIFFCTAIILSGIFRIIFLWFQTKLCHSIGLDLSKDIFQKTLFQDYEIHLSKNSSEIISAITNKVKIIVYEILWASLLVISNSFIFLSIIISLIIIEPFIALTLIFFLGIIYILIILLFKKHLNNYSKTISIFEDVKVKLLQESLNSIRDILIAGNQKIYLDNYLKIDTPLRKAQANAQIIGNSPRFFVEALGIVIIAMFAYYLSTEFNDFTNTISILAALGLGAQRLLPVVQQIYASLSSIQIGKDSLLDVLKLLNQKLPKMNESIIEKIDFKKSISFNFLGFKYSKSKTMVLQKVNFEIRKGSRVGIIGKTGSGKSTLIDILMCLLKPTEGSLSIDGKNISSSNYRSWQSLISHVPQEIFITDATIAENIALGENIKKINLNKIVEISKKAQIHDFIENLDEKYFTKVGELGARLSGGEKQRLGIARALYRKASLIILDEATSSLDASTEQIIMSAIKKLDKSMTFFIVAHRLNTLKDCDVLIKLDKGKVVEFISDKKLIKEITLK